jgi:hypothetical protein
MKIEKGNIPQETKTKEVDFISSLVKEATDEDIKINSLIRERYSMSQEMALHRKKIMGIINDDEWLAYTSFISECIEKAR